MSAITATAVNELRKRTDLPLMECKSALVESAGDMDKAVLILRARFKTVGAKRADNETAEGRVGVFIDAAAKTAAILEMRCESAPVTKSEHFIGLVHDLAKQVAAGNPADPAALIAGPFGDGKMTVTDRINEVIGIIRENMKPQRFTRLTGGVYGEYIHHDGTLGVLLEVTGKETASAELLRDICAHIAALNPPYATVDQLPAEVLEREKAFAKQQTEGDPKNAGKPAQIIEKIMDGKLKTWYAESVLLEQPMANAAKYDKKTVGQLLTGAGLKFVKCVRYKVGELS